MVLCREEVHEIHVLCKRVLFVTGTSFTYVTQSLSPISQNRKAVCNLQDRLLDM